MLPLLHALWQFIQQYHSQLRLTELLLGAFSFVFGAKALGHFHAVREPGGFYTAILVSLPGAGFVFAFNYSFDVLTGYATTQGLRAALHAPGLTPQSIALFEGILIGALPPFITAMHQRMMNRGGKAAIRSTFAVLGYGWITRAALFYIAAAFTVRVVFVVHGWLGGVAPANVILILYSLLGGLMWMGSDVFGAALKVMSDQPQADARTLEGLYFLMMVCYLIFLALTIPVIIGTLLLGLLVGWVVLIYQVVSVIGGYALQGLRALADRLSERALLAIFSAPGTAALILQYILSNADVIPH